MRILTTIEKSICDEKKKSLSTKIYMREITGFRTP